MSGADSTGTSRRLSASESQPLRSVIAMPRREVQAFYNRRVRKTSIRFKESGLVMLRPIAQACRLSVIPLAAVTVISCDGGKATTSPSAVPSPTAPSSSTQLTGFVISNPQGTPVGGAEITIGAVGQVTDAGGRFSVSVANGTPAVRVSAPGYLVRETNMSAAGVARNSLLIDVIANTPPFSLSFFREFARNAADSPGSLATLNPWTMAPSFYIKTTDDAGNPMPDDVIEGLKKIFINSVPPLTSNRFSVRAIETGPADRPAADGWVRILFLRELPNPTAAGDSTVGGNRGLMRIRTTPVIAGSTFGCFSAAGSVAVHEIVHTMGFWHTATPPTATAFGVSTGNAFNCDGVRLPPATQYHVDIAYSRPPGNRDPDSDPSSFLLQRPTGADFGQPVVSCAIPQ